MEAKFLGRVFGVSAAAQKIIDKDVNGGDSGLLHELHATMKAPLAPGAAFDSMNRIMIQNIATSMNTLTSSGESCVKIRLFDWLRHCVTIATTNPVYGPQNPFKDPEIADAFWYTPNTSQLSGQIITNFVTGSLRAICSPS